MSDQEIRCRFEFKDVFGDVSLKTVLKGASII